MIVALAAQACATDESDSLKTGFTPDTLMYIPSGLLDNITPPTDSINYEYHLSQKPMTGLFKSMFIPGWGQLGNDKKLKAGIMFGIDFWLIASAIHYGSQASDFKAQYDSTPDTLLQLRRDYYDLYSDRRNERNKYTWFAAILSFYSMFDAYVDAHMSGYPKKKDEKNISFDLAPNLGKGASAVITFRF